jgi:uncharacterized protein Yka (UPF0111/DUF47 family)
VVFDKGILVKRQRASVIRGIWQKIFPQVPDFQMLVADQSRLLERTLEALAAFLDLPSGEGAEEVREYVEEAHALAQSNLDLLHRSFVTRIDREDIYMLITRVDHVFDYCETSIREVELLDVSADEWMKAMVAQLRKGAAALTTGLEHFRVKAGDAEELAARARRAEREVEALYRQALAELFAEEGLLSSANDHEPVSGKACIDLVFDRIKRREVYRHLSNAADRMAHAGEALHDLIVKYD